MSRYRYFNNAELLNGKTIKGFMRDNFSELLQFEDNITYTIPLFEEFRPDLIANRFYNDPLLSYILIYANKINDSPEGFYYGRKITVPRYERIIGII